MSNTFLSNFANHQAGFSPWQTIGWFNTKTTGKRTGIAYRVNLTLPIDLWSEVLEKMTAASPDQRAIYDWAWSGNSQARVLQWLWPAGPTRGWHRPAATLVSVCGSLPGPYNQKMKWVHMVCSTHGMSIEQSNGRTSAAVWSNLHKS